MCDLFYFFNHTVKVENNFLFFGFYLLVVWDKSSKHKHHKQKNFFENNLE